MPRIRDAEVIDSTCGIYTTHCKAQGMFRNSKHKEDTSQSIEEYAAKMHPLDITYSPLLQWRLQEYWPAQQVQKIGFCPSKFYHGWRRDHMAPPLPEGLSEADGCSERGCHFLQCCSHWQTAYTPVNNIPPRPTQAILDSAGHTHGK